jgi:hypothetical protein
VMRQELTVDEEPVEIGLFPMSPVIIRGLQAGKTAEVSVSARNSAGETLATVAQITLPAAV